MNFKEDKMDRKFKIYNDDKSGLVYVPSNANLFSEEKKTSSIPKFNPPNPPKKIEWNIKWK